MSRSETIRADLERVRGKSKAEFAEEWGEWAEAYDKDPVRVQRHWVKDLETALPFAEREDELLAELVAAKDAYREDHSDANRRRRDEAVAAVEAVRREERASQVGPAVAGDAFVADPVLVLRLRQQPRSED